MSRSGIYRYRPDNKWEVRYDNRSGQELAVYIKTPNVFSANLGQHLYISKSYFDPVYWEFIKPLVEDTDWETDF